MYNFKSSASVQPVIRTPSCQVCLEPYDENRHTPKILQCAHTVCEECVKVLEEQGRRNFRIVDPTSISISCPVCRTVTQTPRSCIRTNYQLIDVINEMRGEANHNIAFVTCIECHGAYHEKDANICTTCSPIKETSHFTDLVSNQIDLSNHSLCSTCLLKEHMTKGHGFIRLQPIRVDMQRLEGQMRIVTCKFAEETKWNWNNPNLGAILIRFGEAQDSFNQKKLFDEYFKELMTKPVLPPIRLAPPPPAPNRRPQRRPNTPHEPLGADYLYYFEL